MRCILVTEYTMDALDLIGHINYNGGVRQLARLTGLTKGQVERLLK